MMEIKLKNVGVNRWQTENLPGMKAKVLVFSKKELLEPIKKDLSLEQLVQAACLPGLLSPVVGMPDIHQGFGLPIGGVMVAENLVSAGAVGMDINCGVRLLLSQLKYDPGKFSPQFLRILLRSIEKLIPIGLGSKQRQMLPQISFNQIIKQGVQALVAPGYALKQDLEAIEEDGCLPGAEPQSLSAQAIKRAQKQLGTLGSGNHFIEIQKVSQIFAKNLADQWGLFEGQVGVMIHSGSRALGQQTCLDYSAKFTQEEKKYQLQAPTRNLASLPADSPTGKAYLSAMAACVNFAFANRQIMTYQVRRVFKKAFASDEARLTLLYDVAHNIAKWEIHQGKRVLVHRKGATRALPAHHPQNPVRYRATGHPAIVPGSMGTPSYIMVGLPAVQESYFSINHGAGRAMSRNEAKRTILKPDFIQKMKNIVYNQPFRVIADEAPQAYKDINLVVETLTEAGLSQKVAQLTPLAVIKGD